MDFTDPGLYVFALVLLATVGILVAPLLDAFAQWWTEYRDDDVAELAARDRRRSV